jgi:hypothetical protein
MGNIAKNGFSAEQVREYHKKFTTRGWNVSEVAWYSFIRLPEFFRTATISRGTGPVKLLEERKDLAEKIGKITNPFPGVTANFGTITLDEYMQKAEIAGLIVAHKGKIVYESTPRLAHSDKHIWWSISKTTVGLMIGLLEADGLINVHKSVAHYIPRLRGTDWEGSTVLDCLHMASGMGGREHDDHEDGKLEGNVPYKEFVGCCCVCGISVLRADIFPCDSTLRFSLLVRYVHPLLVPIRRHFRNHEQATHQIPRYLDFPRLPQAPVSRRRSVPILLHRYAGPRLGGAVCYRQDVLSRFLGEGLEQDWGGV